MALTKEQEQLLATAAKTIDYLNERLAILEAADESGARSAIDKALQTGSSVLGDGGDPNPRSTDITPALQSRIEKRRTDEFLAKVVAKDQLTKGVLAPQETDPNERIQKMRRNIERGRDPRAND